MLMSSALAKDLFQSTCPVGGTTSRADPACPGRFISIHVPRGGHDKDPCGLFRHVDDFNPRAPWGARHIIFENFDPLVHISIHVPRGGHDQKQHRALNLTDLFQSTCPVGGTTRAAAPFRLRRRDFNPRAPWGARHLARLNTSGSRRDFNPRAPWGARPVAAAMCGNFWQISIHVPRGGHDPATKPKR